MSQPFLIQQINPIRLKGSSPKGFIAFGNRVLFRADDGVLGEELWITDGTSTGTSLLKDIAVGQGGSAIEFLTVLGNRMFFSADDGVKGEELWLTDGTTTGTQQVKDLLPGEFGSFPGRGVVLGNKLFFLSLSSDSGFKQTLWESDGTETGTRLIKTIADNGFTLKQQITRAGDLMFFEAPGTVVGTELWVSDGTAAGTRVLKDINPGENGSEPAQLTALGSQILLRTRTEANGFELWASDGSELGTRLVKDIRPGSQSSFPYGLTLFGNKLFFSANDGVKGDELWVSDSTTAGTRLIKDIHPGPGGSGPRFFTPVGNRLFFIADDGSTGEELWVTDGTTAGTRLVKDIRPGGGDDWITELTVLGNSLFFIADDGRNGRELWTSDGTEKGTRLVADANPGPASFFSASGYGGLTAIGDKLVFAGMGNALDGAELWGLKTSALLSEPSSELSITSQSASRIEGNSGATPFTFQVTRSGNSTGSASVRWGVSATGSSPATASDFGTSALPSGTVSFAAGQTRQTITVIVAGDLSQEGDETFRVTLSAATGATITTATADGTILNDDLIGDTNRNRLVGTARAEFIDGRANLDTLTGGGAADVFGFRFGESKLSAPDSITDFAFGTDKIDLFAANGGTVPAPLRFSRAANNSTAKTLAALSTAVFTDANGALAGKQALPANGAALVRATNAAIAGTYLVINNSVGGRSDSDDLMIKLNGFSGTLPGLGAIGTGVVFV